MNDSQFQHPGAEYQVGDAIQGRWVVRAICGGPGRSGMGVVYVVDDRLRQETLAVKTLQPQFVANVRVRELLHQEANLWFGMGRHSNIVALTYVDAPGTQLYLFMEYIEPDARGRNCLTHFLTEQPLPPAMVAKWCLGICAAMTHMRAHGVQVHRDFKPDNLMIDRSGSIRVTDFGLAHAFSALQPPVVGEQLPGITVIGNIVGTPGYIAPEVIQGEPHSVASDVYAFGLVLVQMVTGKPWAPFTAQWRGDVLEYERATLRIREALHEPLSGTPFAALAAQCLEFDPAKRFPGFDAIASELGAVCARAGIAPDTSAVTAGHAPSARPDADQVYALYGLGRLHEALDLVRKLRAANTSDALLLTCEGVIRSDLGDAESAIPLLQRACASKPSCCSYWNNLGRTLRAAQRTEEALHAFEQAIRCDAIHANIWTSKGNCLFDLGGYPEALAAYDRAVALDRYYWAAQLGRALSLAKLGRLIDALSAIERVLEVEPDNAEALRLFEECAARLRTTPAALSPAGAIERAKECLASEQTDEGLRVVREARFRHGASGDLWNAEGVFLTDAGDYRGALRCLDLALRDDANSCEAWTNKGRTYRRMNKLQDAVLCHERAATLRPDEPIPWLNWSICCSELGLEEQAHQCFRVACARASTEAQKDMCRLQGADQYYAAMAEIALAAKDYAEAHRCASSVAKSSRWYADATQCLARARFYLAVQFVEQDLAERAQGLATALDVLERAAAGLASDAERDAVRQQMSIVCNQYLQTAWPRLVSAKDLLPVKRFLQLLVGYGAAEELQQWAQRQLAVVLTNEAVATYNVGVQTRQALIDNLSRRPRL